MSNNRGGGPIPRIGFGGPGGRGGGMGGQGGNMRGGGGMRGGGPMRGGMQRPGQRRDNFRQPGQHTQGQGKRVDQSPRMDRKRKEKTEAKTTMTDFRIVGIEVKSLDWSWGLIGEHVFEEDEKEKEAEAKPEAKEEPKEESAVKDEKKAEKPAEEPASEAKEEKDEADEAKPEVKEETKEDAADEAAEPTVGAKRKAKPSSIDGDESPKKRTSSFVSHKDSGGDKNILSSPESNQNRFRIYFESPPELDRVPKSARRNPNKRWRRESSSVAPSRLGEVEEHDEENAESQEQHEEHAEQPQGEAKPAKTPADGEAKEEAKPEAEAEAKDEAQPEPEAKDEEKKAEGEDAGDAGDVSMVSASGETAEDTAAAVEAALAESAQNAASAYGNRTSKSRSRRWSTSSLESHQSDAHALGAEDPNVPQPSVNRVSVLYEESSRRLVFDASVVSKIRIFRAEGRIEVDLLPQTEKPEPKAEAEAKPEKADGEEKPADEEKKDEASDESKPEEKSDDLPKGVLVSSHMPFTS